MINVKWVYYTQLSDCENILEQINLSDENFILNFLLDSSPEASNGSLTTFHLVLCQRENIKVEGYGTEKFLSS